MRQAAAGAAGGGGEDHRLDSSLRETPRSVAMHCNLKKSHIHEIKNFVKKCRLPLTPWLAV